MMRRVALLCAGGLMTVATANALVLPEKSAEQKFRRDVGKQLTKYTLCVVKAAQKCEKNGTSTAVECHLDTLVVEARAHHGNQPVDLRLARHRGDQGHVVEGRDQDAMVD